MAWPAKDIAQGPYATAVFSRKLTYAAVSPEARLHGDRKQRVDPLPTALSEALVELAFPIPANIGSAPLEVPVPGAGKLLPGDTIGSHSPNELEDVTITWSSGLSAGGPAGKENYCTAGVIHSHPHEESGQRVQNEAEVFPEPPLVSLGVSTPTENSNWQLWRSQPTQGKPPRAQIPRG